VRKKAEKATINQLYVVPHTAQYDSISYKMTMQGGKWQQPTGCPLQHSGGGIGNGCCQLGRQH